LASVSVAITKFVDSAQPGWVECVLRDAHGVAWTFVEKVPVVTTESLSESSAYPRTGSIACEVVGGRPPGAASALVQIDTSRPWGIEASDGTTKFTVQREQLVDE
jgi:hypothetical protein